MAGSAPLNADGEPGASMNRVKHTRGEGRRAAWARFLALVMAALTVASQASSVTHLLLVEHAVCPQHGEWIHADQLAEHAESSPADTHHARTKLEAPLQPDGEHEHEHCAAVSDRRELLTGEARSFSASLPPCDDHAALSSTHEPRVRVVPLFYIAPKNSPPV
jgi:hypothetical protein